MHILRLTILFFVVSISPLHAISDRMHYILGGIGGTVAEGAMLTGRLLSDDNRVIDKHMVSALVCGGLSMLGNFSAYSSATNKKLKNGNQKINKIYYTVGAVGGLLSARACITMAKRCFSDDEDGAGIAFGMAVAGNAVSIFENIRAYKNNNNVENKSLLFRMTSYFRG